MSIISASICIMPIPASFLFTQNLSISAFHWTVKLIHHKWLSMNKDVAYRKIMKIRNRVHIQNLGKYSAIVKIKWFNEIKDT
jgi:hypothetical protein